MTGLAGRLLAGTAAPFLLAAALAAHAADTVPVPKLTGRVVDLTATLDRAQQQAIAGKLAAFERAKGSQVAVLLVPTIGTETIEEFATRVTDEWKLGRAGVDDGVLFVMWDEGDESLGSEASDGPIPFIVLSPRAKKGYASPTPFTHSSYLRTIETIFGVPFLRGAQNAKDLSEMFTSFP